MGSEIDAAWNDLHDATPSGWHVGRPMYHDDRREWQLYAFDPLERPRVGHRSREWLAVGASELEVLREMARCLRLIREGRTPG